MHGALFALSLQVHAALAAPQPPDSAAPPPDSATPEAPPAAAPSQDVTSVEPPAAVKAAPQAVPLAQPKSAFDVVPTGYVETYYAYNFNRPSNGITNARGFDNRHNTLTLSNAAMGANWTAGPVSGRLILQVGSTPSTYYGGEPSLAGASGANATSSELWKYLQEAFLAYRAPVGRGLLVQAGLVASPIGFETFAVKDNWTWSRSNLFFGFPFYHTGLRLTYEWTDAISTTLSVFNGWNSVVDNNDAKSVQASIAYKLPRKLAVQALYFGGVERPAGAPEGPWWRHHFDATAQYDVTTFLSFAAQADYGWEANRIGTARWLAGAAYIRAKPFDRVYVALRGDHFREHLATSADLRASSPLFWTGVEWVSSVTSTLELRPHDQIAFRLEFRHDAAATPLYFAPNTRGTGTATTPYLPNARTQDTLLLGATAWF